MGKKRRNHPNVEELIDRPWCYYCERDFEDLKLLISHQKAKHFKCERCGRRLNTAGGLSVHMNQVHKETLSLVENAIEGREGLDVEIFGMEGVPDEAVQQHNQQIMEDYHKHRADRQAATGNPPPGAPGSQRPMKKFKYETSDELKARLKEWRAQAPSRKALSENAAASAAANGINRAGGGPLQGQAAVPGAVPGYGPPGIGGPPGTLPTRPPGTGTHSSGATGLPQRPSSYGGGLPGAGTGAASTLDDLVSGAAHGDDIDKIIRMAEAGIKPPGAEEKTDKTEKHEKAEKKKDKSMRMVYSDGDFSLEERMAQMARYRVAAA